jgi:Helix-turn-helix domain
MSRMNTPTTPLPPQLANVIAWPIDKKARRRAEDKWSSQVIKLGYTPLPSLLLRAQAKLKLTPAQLNVLIQIIEHWWEADKDPFPAKETIARRMDMSPRQIQRILTQLEKSGHIKRIKRYLGHKAQTSNAYSLDGLVKKLAALEPEFRKAQEQNKLRRKKVEAGTAA